MMRALRTVLAIGAFTLLLGADDGTGCGSESDAPPPPPAECEAFCDTSSSCPLAVPYTCSDGGGCYQTLAECDAACCPE